MPQGPIATQTNVLKPSGSVGPAKGDANGNQVTSGVGGTSRSLNVNGAAAQIIKATAGMVCTAVVLVAGSAVGTINDCAATADIATANQVAVLPNTVGPVSLQFPCATGIVVTPGTGQRVSISYQ